MMRRMRMKTVIALLCAVMLVSLMGCATVPTAKNDASEAASAETPQNTSAAVQADQEPEQGSDRESEEKMSISMIDQTESITEMDSLSLTIDNTPVEVIWEDNESIEALKELVTDGPLTVQMSMYSTFEQVGSLGTRRSRRPGISCFIPAIRSSYSTALIHGLIHGLAGSRTRPHLK